jgi:hypothetical protein
MAGTFTEEVWREASPTLDCRRRDGCSAEVRLRQMFRFSGPGQIAETYPASGLMPPFPITARDARLRIETSTQ